jgi:hypothetical protein
MSWDNLFDPCDGFSSVVEKYSESIAFSWLQFKSFAFVTCMVRLE